MITDQQIQDAYQKTRRAQVDWQDAGKSQNRAMQVTHDRRCDWDAAQGEYEALVRQQREEQAIEEMSAVSWVRWTDALGARHWTNVPTDKVPTFVQALAGAGFTEIGPVQTAAQGES